VKGFLDDAKVEGLADGRGGQVRRGIVYMGEMVVRRGLQAGTATDGRGGRRGRRERRSTRCAKAVLCWIEVTRG
jgi:hypothetical protein